MFHDDDESKYPLSASDKKHADPVRLALALFDALLTIPHSVTMRVRGWMWSLSDVEYTRGDMITS